MSDAIEKKRPYTMNAWSTGECYPKEESDAIFEELEAERDQLKADLAREKERVKEFRDLVSDISYYAPSTLCAEHDDDGRRDLWVRIRAALEAR